MVVSIGTPLFRLSLSLLHINCKRNLRFPCPIFFRKYCSNNENNFAHSVIFGDRKETYLNGDKLQDFILLFSSILVQNRYHPESKPDLSKLLDKQKWMLKQSKTVYPPCLQPEITSKFIDGLSMAFKSLSVDELLTVIRCLDQCKNLDNAMYSALLSKLDRECTLRLPQWNWNTSCRVLQEWYSLNLIKLCHFYKKAMSHYSLLIHEMNAQQLVEFSFFLNLNRSFPTKLNHRNFENQLLLSFNDFSLNEIGVISMAFFKCQKEIRNPALLEQLISAVKDNAATIDDITLAAMLKLIRRSCSDASKTPASVMTLFDALIDVIDQFNPKVVIQLVVVAGSLNYFHHPTLEKVARMFNQKISTTRLKDLERFALSLSSSGYKSKSVEQFWKLVEMDLVKSERQAEISNFPRSLISLLVYFVSLGKFPEELFRIAFRPENVTKTLGSTYTSVRREIPLLYHSIRIECPQYEGPVVPLTIIKGLEDQQERSLPGMKNKPLNYTDKFLLQLLDDTRSILGGEHLAVLSYLQTHFITPDVLFCIDEEKKCAMEICKSSLDNDRGMTGSKKWCTVVAGTRAMFTRNNHCAKGILQMKLRQLNILGYQSVLVPWFGYMHLHRNDRLNYLRAKMNQCYSLSENKIC